MATQKNVLSDITYSSAPSPPARERIPPSFESRSRTSSPYSSLTSSASTIVANSFIGIGSTGSDSNLNRMFPTNGSMRQQLLRRLWYKEYRRLDRTGSLSPPLHRSPRTKRAVKVHEMKPEVCLKCQRLEQTHFNHSVPEISMKYTKHNTNSIAFTRKSFSIETETINDKSMISSTSSEQRKTSASPTQSNTNSAVSTNQSTIENAAVMLNDISATEDQINGNNSTQTNGDNSFIIEMKDDQINITTMATAESTIITDSTIQMSSNETISHQYELSNESTSQSTNEWQHSIHDGNNNNDENDSKTKITEIGHIRGGIYDAYHMSSGQIDLENESVVRLKTHEPLDQNTIDTIISQVLVDSLNNIIVVQGKSHEFNEENAIDLTPNQTQTNHITNMDGNHSNTSSLPHPLQLSVTEQIYFPQYLSAESLSESSTKLTEDSNAVDSLPSNLVISVISGSSYPCDAGETIVYRITDMSRTESMEVQPSTAASINGDDINDNRINETIASTTTTVNNNNDDHDDNDVVSLVDSLEDPNAITNVSELNDELRILEKSQAFFVPIESNESSIEILPSPVKSSEYNLYSPISKTMPDRLRERLEKRKIEMNERKAAEAKRRQEKIQKLISQHGSSKSSLEMQSNSPKSFEILTDELPKHQQESHTLQTKIVMTKTRGKKLQSDIGSLESYTVDAQGNLKFIEAGKKTNGTKKGTTISRPVVKHVAIKKTITTSKQPLINMKKTRNNKASENETNEKRLKIPKNTVKYRVKDIASHKTPKDVQKITLGQHSPSDMITPDRDCGPRRMYQKTEIREGAKRIEILEIVECKFRKPKIFF